MSDKLSLGSGRDSSRTLSEHPLYNRQSNSSFEEVTFVFSTFQKPASAGGSSTQVFSMPVLLKNLDDYVMPAAFGLGMFCTLLLILTFMCTPIKSSALSQKHPDRLRDQRLLADALAFLVHVRTCSRRTPSVFCGTLPAPAGPQWCSTFRTKCIIIVIFVFSLVGFAHNIWVFHVQEAANGKSTCSVMPGELQVRHRARQGRDHQQQYSYRWSSSCGHRRGPLHQHGGLLHETILSRCSPERATSGEGVQARQQRQVPFPFEQVRGRHAPASEIRPLPGKDARDNGRCDCRGHLHLPHSPRVNLPHQECLL
ncbi:hypothetical protein Btru_067099 [Bulinus truncatus]|nr:hypothetical protein Btru_067099 [Bulinus truncatus]